MKKVAIVQSCYIPWKGYFDLIAQVDEFIFLDDAQYTRRDWRNRNRIKTPDGVKWLTIPLNSKGQFESRIEQMEVADSNWTKKHWRTLAHNYSKAQHFDEVSEWGEELFEKVSSPYLSHINAFFVSQICNFLKIPTNLSWSTDYGRSDLTKTERLVELCLAAQATHYLSGPSAQDYLEVERFKEVGISVDFANYDGYPEYSQPHPPFCHTVSILDLIFSTGRNSTRFLKHVR